MPLKVKVVEYHKQEPLLMNVFRFVHILTREIPQKPVLIPRHIGEITLKLVKSEIALNTIAL